jgi:hypothetical protein
MVRDVGNGVREGGTRAEMMEGHCPRAGGARLWCQEKHYGTSCPDSTRYVNVTALFGRGFTSPSHGVQTLRERRENLTVQVVTDSSPAMNLALHHATVSSDIAWCAAPTSYPCYVPDLVCSGANVL